MFLSLWLTSNNQTINEIIKTLANEEKTPIFSSHITLINQINLGKKKESEIKKTLEDLSKSIKPLFPLTLTTKAVEISESFTKTLFITFQPDQKLLEIRKIAQEVLLKNSFSQFNKNFSPHLSLIYKHILQERKIELKEKVSKKLPKRISFNHLLAIKEEKPIEKPEDVKNWEYIKV